MRSRAYLSSALKHTDHYYSDNKQDKCRNDYNSQNWHFEKSSAVWAAFCLGINHFPAGSAFYLFHSPSIAFFSFGRSVSAPNQMENTAFLNSSP